MIKFTPDEINIVCSNLERSRHFYCDVLGFEELEHEEGALHLSCQGRRFLLLPIAQQLSNRRDYCTVPEFSMDLMVEDIETAYNYLQGQSVTFEREWQPDAISFIIRDPDGLIWEIIQSRLD